MANSVLNYAVQTKTVATNKLTYRAIHGAGPSYFQSCFTRIADMLSQRRLHSSGSDLDLIACTYRSFVDPQSAVAHSQLPASRYGTTCRLTSQLRRHTRSSDSGLRHFCSRAHTLTLSLNLQTMYLSSIPVRT